MPALLIRVLVFLARNWYRILPWVLVLWAMKFSPREALGQMGETLDSLIWLIALGAGLFALPKFLEYLNTRAQISLERERHSAGRPKPVNPDNQGGGS